MEFSADLTQLKPDNTGHEVEVENTAGDLEAVSVSFPATVPLQGGLQSAPPKFFRVAVSGG